MRTLCLAYAAFFGMVLAHGESPVTTPPSDDVAQYDTTVPVHTAWGPMGVGYPVEDVAL